MPSWRNQAEFREQLLKEYDIPQTLHEGIEGYLFSGSVAGEFLTAVFCNDLIGSFGKADLRSRRAMYEICRMVYSEFPAEAHGSLSKVYKWRKQGGLEGRDGG